MCAQNYLPNKLGFVSEGRAKIVREAIVTALFAHVAGNKASSNVVNATLCRFFRAILREAFVFDCERSSVRRIGAIVKEITFC